MFLPHLLDQDEGHVVNTASIAGLAGVAALGVYCTTKFAVVGLSESLHLDLAARGSNVGVSVLCPGFVATRIFDSHRNMPDAVRAVATLDQEADEVQRTIVGLGIPATDVAEKVFAAIEDRRFFVLPHERAALQSVESRLSWLGGGEPVPFEITSLLRP